MTSSDTKSGVPNKSQIGPMARLSDAEHQSLADGLKALGHPSRLEMIRQLALRDPCCGGDFCDCMPLAQSTISQHLDLLASAGLVNRQQEGTRSLFTLNRERLQELSRDLSCMCDRVDFTDCHSNPDSDNSANENKKQASKKART